MEKATEAKNVKQTINGCGNLAFLEHEICSFSSPAAFEFRGAKMTDVRNKNRAKQSKTNSCYLWCGSTDVIFAKLALSPKLTLLSPVHS